MTKPSPLVLFVYNRPRHTEQVLTALCRNSLAPDTHLYIFSDAPKDEEATGGVHEVRSLIHDLQGFRRIDVVEQEQNLGLARSIIEGVTTVVNRHGHAIVLEDDLITSPTFLSFMNQALDVYRERRDILSITGFSFPAHFMGFSDRDSRVYLNIRPMSWSWATWQDRWNLVDWSISDYQEFIQSNSSIRAFNRGGTDLTDLLKLHMQGKIDSWYIRWAYHAYRSRLLTVYPAVSFVNNIGHDGTGVHCGSTTNYIFIHRELNKLKAVEMPENLTLDQATVDRFNRAFNIPFRSRLKKIFRSLLGH